MPTTTQLANMAERAKGNGAKPAQASDPAPAPAAAPAERPPVASSAPIMGPVTKPIEYGFVPAPATLTPAQRAVLTRQARAAGIAPAKGEAVKAPAAPARPLGVELVLGIRYTKEGMDVSFRFRSGDGPADPAAIPATETALPLIWAGSKVTESGELEPASYVTLSAFGATADQVACALPVMRRLNGLILGAYADSEDHSFPQLVLTLATGLRVDRLELHQPDGSITTAKRGAAYISAFKLWEAHRKA